MQLLLRFGRDEQVDPKCFGDGVYHFWLDEHA